MRTDPRVRRLRDILSLRVFSPRRRWVARLAVYGALYVGLWLLTRVGGAPAVRAQELLHMAPPGDLSRFKDLDASRREPAVGEKVYYCRVTSYLPFLCEAESGWHSGPLSGGGSRALYLWLPGKAFRLTELDAWSE